MAVVKHTLPPPFPSRGLALQSLGACRFRACSYFSISPELSCLCLCRCFCLSLRFCGVLDKNVSYTCLPAKEGSLCVLCAPAEHKSYMPWSLGGRHLFFISLTLPKPFGFRQSPGPVSFQTRRPKSNHTVGIIK